MYCFTSITNNYLPKARVLAKSLKKYHPEWKFILVVSEPLPNTITLPAEPFDQIITIDQLEIPNYYSWIFMHNIMEICTAVKGIAANYILEKLGADKLIYLDPDIVVYNSLQEIEELLNQYPILLTPHQTKAENNYQDILANEVCFLKHGIYNLGFFAVSNLGQGKKFINWYSERLLNFCFIDFDYGLYTDQRWCDLAPVLFDQLFILRDSTYNVARWNVSQRLLSMDLKDSIYVDGNPLKFFHFSGYDSGQGTHEISKYISTKDAFFNIWNNYRQQLIENGEEAYGKVPWKYNFFDDGTKIKDEMRLVYRRRTDLQSYFKNPFSNPQGTDSFLYWYNANYTIKGNDRCLIQRAKSILLFILIKIKKRFVN